MKKKRTSGKGFTLVELIVVIAVLAILAATAIISIGNVNEQARQSTLNANINIVVRTLNTYNSLVGSGDTITYDGDVSTDVLGELILSRSSGDLVDMNLSMDISESELYDVLDEIYYDGMWRRYDWDGGYGSQDSIE